MTRGASAVVAAVIALLGLLSQAKAQPADINSMTKGPVDDAMIDGRQRVLYTFDDDFYDRPTCLGRCAEDWPPFEPKAEDLPGAGFAMVRRADGKWQWSYVGRPLYYSARDRNAYDVRGHGIDGLWHYARLPGGND
jgi:predicted lipoprotein with Yx(FWY)xxD motif